MAYLPQADRAVIDKSKLVDYVLSPDHMTGRHKARVFQSALGIGREDWEYLRNRIGEAVPSAPVAKVTTGSHGVRYSVSILVEGLNGETHEVVTGWIVEGDSPPRLTSAYVNIP